MLRFNKLITKVNYYVEIINYYFIFSFTVSADNDLYYATLVKNIKVNNSNIEDDVIDDDNVENGESLSEIPKCEEIGEVGDLDCMGFKQ